MWKFIKLTKSGRPIKANPYKSLIEPKDFKDDYNYDYGLVPNEGYVVLDVDDMHQSDIFLQFLLDQGYKFNCMATTRGKHFWFKTKTIHTNTIGNLNALGIKIDIRSGGKNCFLRAKKEGIWRQWLVWNRDDLDYIDEYLLSNPRFNNIKFDGNGCRNDTLFRLVSLYTHLGYSPIVKEMCCRFINEHFVVGPLDEREFNQVVYKHRDFYMDSKYEREYKETYLLENNQILEITYTYDSETDMKKVISQKLI